MPGHFRFMRDGLAGSRHTRRKGLLAVAAGAVANSDASSACAVLSGCVPGAVAVDGYGFQTKFPSVHVCLQHILNSGISGHVDGFADGAGQEGLDSGHHCRCAW